MSCTNCYDGCGTPVPDACVKYTGQDIPLFGLCTGDPLSKVEEVLINKLTSALDGTGILLSDITLNCSFITDLLNGQDKTLVNLIQVLVQANCTLKEMVDAIEYELTAPYTFNTVCLEGLNQDSTRDDILQAAINKICSVAATTDIIFADYVKATDLNSLIAQYLLTAGASGDQQSAKMVPYVAYEYYGSLSNFDSGGKGLSSAGFNKVYICNGQNGTPDKRGRVAVGAIQGVPGGTLDAAVDPNLPANPNTNYTLSQKFGQSYVALNIQQMPAHTHTVNDPGHAHSYTFGGNSASGSNEQGYQRWDTNNQNKTTQSSQTHITIGNAGGSQSHENRQPSIAAYYIMYIP
jgi:hypothetical protein